MRAFSCLLAASLLLAYRASAQQPALPGAPQPTQPAPPAAPPTQRELPAAEVIGHPEVIGQTYSIETVGGIQFTGTLRAANEVSLTFETKELGLVTVQRTSVRQLMNQTPEQARRGFDYVGNGTHHFLTPTARGLHQGEGYVQVVNIFVVNAHYGITDNISVGISAPVIPFVGIPVVAVSPKVSVPVGKDFHLGAGVLYAFATGASGASGGAGVGYGVATYGSADANFSFGLGYGIGSSGVGGSPVGVIAGNLRFSRLFSVVNETYLTSFDGSSGFGGLAGVRYATPRFSGSLGALYVTTSVIKGIYPAWLEVTYRFGHVRLK